MEKINDHFIAYKGPKDENGFPTTYIDDNKKIFQTSIRLKELVVTNTEQSYVLGTKKDLQKFKEFVERKE